MGHQFPIEKVVDFTNNWLSMMGIYGIFMGSYGDLGVQQLDGTFIVELIYDSEGG